MFYHKKKMYKLTLFDQYEDYQDYSQELTFKNTPNVSLITTNRMYI